MMKQRQTVMIIDDNLIDQMITAHVLKKTYAKGDILVMESATEALDFLDSNKDNLSAIPSLILLDIDMPQMNGFEFLDRFKMFAQTLKDSCRIVVITGSDIPEDIELMKTYPHVTKLILKPLNHNELVPVI
ncbi:response regulator [Pedobacter frigiditerrae]|uniref:Response regulator n=1 Tax=Pedobacter frigiditerrae TaxID=2530452 RepID=A0A4R0MXT8_9SPHI|nr:response regulator [Pedobacter frigiditerrae]TCC91703.1 response regulator [Pedobacter frigiditerrae]